jgi:hypothetical protein
MKEVCIRVNFDEGGYEDCQTLEEAREAVLHAHACEVHINSVVGLDENGRLIGRYGCSWDVTLEKLSPDEDEIGLEHELPDLED